MGVKPRKKDDLKVTVQPKAQAVVVQEPAKVAEATKVVETTKVVEEVKPAPRPKVTKGATRPLVSLSDIFSGTTSTASEAAENEAEAESSRIDPRSKELLEGARAAILEYIASWRPRFAVPFEAMVIEANKMIVKIPTSELQLEIERSKSELLHKVVEITGVNGLIELELILDEKIVASRPVKLEDKIAHLVKINPNISKFKERFNLYVE